MFYENAKPSGKGQGIKIEGIAVIFVREDSTPLMLMASPQELVSGEKIATFGIAGRNDVDCSVSRDNASRTVVFSLVDIETHEVLESVDIPYAQFFKT